MRFAEVAIPERMADAVGAFDLNGRSMATAELALTLGLVVDAAGANASGLAVFTASPQVRAEVVHKPDYRPRSGRLGEVGNYE